MSGGVGNIRPQNVSDACRMNRARLNQIVNRPFLILLLSGLFPGALLAQTGSIQGMIVDASSKAPVAAARVVLVGAHLEELSHASGKFHFDRVPAGRHTIR